MSSTQQVLLKKLSTGFHNQKMIEAAERRDYAAVCFQLLKELSDAEYDIEQHEATDKHNHELHQKVLQKLKKVKEENVALKETIKQQSFHKDLAQRGAEQMLAWYEDDDQLLREEIEHLSSANIHLQKEINELIEEKEDLRQQVGYSCVVLEESKRTIRILAEEKDAQARYTTSLEVLLADEREKIGQLEQSERRWEKGYKEQLAKANERVAAISVFPIKY